MFIFERTISIIIQISTQLPYSTLLFTFRLITEFVSIDVHNVFFSVNQVKQTFSFFCYLVMDN